MFNLEEAIKENQVQLERIAEIGNSLNISKLKENLSQLEEQTKNQDFWNDAENSRKILSNISDIKNRISSFSDIEKSANTIKEMIELLQLEQDEEIEKEVSELISDTSRKIDDLEISTLLSGKYDKNNAIITIHPRCRRNRGSRLGRNAL